MLSRCFSGSNNTNKLSPQERYTRCKGEDVGSNNTNKLSPQELMSIYKIFKQVQIIQINLALKNPFPHAPAMTSVQIIQINLALKNCSLYPFSACWFK